MSFQIIGIGTSVPTHCIAQSDAASLAQVFCGDGETHARTLAALYRRTGVRTRHSVVLNASTNGEPASQSFYSPANSSQDRGPTTALRMRHFEQDIAPLAQRAVGAALEDGSVDPSRISHLVTVSCSGFSAPGFDVTLIRDLGMRPEVQRTNIGFMGCHGALNGLRVAKAFTDADADACVLLCAAELCSLHQQYGFSPDRIVSNALFADGAAAVVGKRGSGKPANELPWRVAASGSTIIPDTESLMSWKIRDHGFEMSLSAKVPDTIRGHLRAWLARWLAKNQLELKDIRGWAIHPGGPKILQACQEALEIDDEMLQPSRSVLADFGNMSSPTVLFILDRLRQSPENLPCVTLGFGPGLTVEAALIQ